MRLLLSLPLFLLSGIVFAADRLEFTNWSQVYSEKSDYYDSGAVNDSGTVVIANWDFILTSTKGTAWQKQQVIPSSFGICCVHINDLFLIGGGYDSDINSRSLTSFACSRDGYNWTTNLFNDSGYGHIRSITYGNGEYVAAADFDYIFRSSDGTNWVRDASQNTYGFTSIQFGDGVFVGLDFNFRTYVSTDAQQWTKTPNPSSSHGSGDWLVFGNGVFLAYSGYPTALIWSNDGYNWRAVPDIPQYGGNKGYAGLTYASGRFLATTYDRRFAHSVDGYNWTVAGDIAFPPGYPDLPPPRIITAVHGRAYAAGPGVLQSPEFTNLLNPRDDPFHLLAFGRPGSAQMLEYRDSENFSNGWTPLQQFTIAATGQTTLTNWGTSESSPRIFRLRSMP